MKSFNEWYRDLGGETHECDGCHKKFDGVQADKELEELYVDGHVVGKFCKDCYEKDAESYDKEGL